MQRRFWNWKDDDLTIDIDQWLIGIVDSGRFRGFDPVLGGTMTLTLNHATTGAIRVGIDKLYTSKFGVLATKQGLIVQEYDPVDLVVPTTPSGKYRKGVVIFTHEYTTVVGGQEGLYSIIWSALTNVGDDLDFPALDSETTQTILGYITLPENCTALNNAGVVYTQGKIPSFANQADFIEKTNGFFLTNLDARNHKIVNLLSPVESLDAANKLYVDTVFSNIKKATETFFGIVRIATTAEAEAGTDDEAVITPFKWVKAFIANLASQSEANGDTVDNKALTPKTLANRTASETRKGVARIATEAEAIAGEDDLTIITPFKLRKALPLTPEVVDLGAWDMDTNDSITIPHSFDWWDKVVSSEVTIVSDIAKIFKFKHETVSIDATEIFVEKLAGTFTGSDFNASTGNRGYIVFWVKLDIPDFEGYLNVNAGADQTKVWPFNTTLPFTVNLVGFVESGGSALTGITWSLVSGPVGAITSFSAPTSAITNFLANQYGTYTLKLTGTNAAGLTAEDSIVLYMSQAANIPPVITNILVPSQGTAVSGGSTFTTDGTIVATDADGDSLTYALTEVRSYDSGTGTIGPDVVGSTVGISITGNTFHLSNMVATSTNGQPVESDGSRWYYFKVTVSDGNGGTAVSAFKIKVAPIPNPNPSLTFAPDENPAPNRYTGALIMNNFANVTKVTMTITSFSVNPPLLLLGTSISSTAYAANGTYVVNELIRSNSPFSFQGRGSDESQYWPTVTFKAFNAANQEIGYAYMNLGTR